MINAPPPGGPDLPTFDHARRDTDGNAAPNRAFTLNSKVKVFEHVQNPLHASQAVSKTHSRAAGRAKRAHAAPLPRPSSPFGLAKPEHARQDAAAPPGRPPESNGVLTSVLA
ncbi:hypothetical protein GCM10010428_49200 [Actinosynnema pretiosum subsp. pretiosum]